MSGNIDPSEEFTFRHVPDLIAIAECNPPPGYVVVPVEPTREMLLAGSGRYSQDPIDADVYKRMISARPGAKP